MRLPIAVAFLFVALALEAAQSSSAVVPLLTTDSLAGWKVEHPGGTTVKVAGGVMAITPKAGWVYTDRTEFHDFKLRFQLKSSSPSAHPLIALFGISPKIADVRNLAGLSAKPPAPGSGFAFPLLGDVPDAAAIGHMNLRVFQTSLPSVAGVLRGGDAWQEYELTRDDGTMSVVVNGSRVLYDPAPMTADGWIGFLTDDGALSLRNVEVSEITPRLPPASGVYIYKKDDGVILPRVLKEVKPNYTADALRAKINGVVQLELIVEPDGGISRPLVVRSLDQRYGLDDEAVKAAQQWRFSPALKDGLPIRMAISMGMTFSIEK
jgi:TonB family protein